MGIYRTYYQLRDIMDMGCKPSQKGCADLVDLGKHVDCRKGGHSTFFLGMLFDSCKTKNINAFQPGRLDVTSLRPYDWMPYEAPVHALWFRCI